MQKPENVQERERVVDSIKLIQADLAKIGVTQVLIFGSVAKAIQNEDSDLDILVHPKLEDRKAEIEEIFKAITRRKIELVFRAWLAQPHKDEILSSAISVINLDIE
jgi:predicted nucleotidyltransferase